MLPDAPAQKLVLDSKTVRNQVSTILSKLQVVSRSEAVIKAREAGFGNERTRHYPPGTGDK
jgi:DNA-binding CsgD family transcriptional regulator